MNIEEVYKDMAIIGPTINKVSSNMPPPFISDISPLSEYLAICNIGTKRHNDTYLLPQEIDDCTEYSTRECETPIDPITQLPKCKLYKDELCVHSSRIKPFANFSKEMGNKIQGKFTRRPYNFVIYASYKLYKIIVSLQTNHFYFLCNIGSYVPNFNPQLLDEIKSTIFKIIAEEPTAKIVLCGHSMGGSLALKCSEIIATEDIDFFNANCITIAFAPFPVLTTSILNDNKNVSVYFSSIQIGEHSYIDPVYFKNNAKKNHHLPFNLLHFEKDTVSLKVITTQDGFIPYNSTINEIVTELSGLIHLHTLSTYLNFFYIFYLTHMPIDGGKKYKSRKNKKRKTKKHKNKLI